ncbi:hypothetical protein GQ457_09G025020 [Hibiscus cannabinus]
MHPSKGNIPKALTYKDDEYKAKVLDFETSRSTILEQTHVTTQKPISSSQSVEMVRSLANLFTVSMRENSLSDIVDPMVQNSGIEEEIVAVAKLASKEMLESQWKEKTHNEGSCIGANVI